MLILFSSNRTLHASPAHSKYPHQYLPYANSFIFRNSFNEICRILPLHPIKVYNSTVFNMFTELCKRHHNWLQNMHYELGACEEQIRGKQGWRRKNELWGLTLGRMMRAAHGSVSRTGEKWLDLKESEGRINSLLPNQWASLEYCQSPLPSSTFLFLHFRTLYSDRSCLPSWSFILRDPSPGRFCLQSTAPLTLFRPPANLTLNHPDPNNY